MVWLRGATVAGPYEATIRFCSALMAVSETGGGSVEEEASGVAPSTNESSVASPPVALRADPHPGGDEDHPALRQSSSDRLMVTDAEHAEGRVHAPRW
jgi:hypothetical protein